MDQTRLSLLCCIITHLVAGRAARFEDLCMVSAAVDLSVLEEVDKVDQELGTHATHEAGGVPGGARACPGRVH